MTPARFPIALMRARLLRAGLAIMLALALAVLPLPYGSMAHGVTVAGLAQGHHVAPAAEFAPLPPHDHRDRDRTCCAQDCCLSGCLAHYFCAADSVLPSVLPVKAGPVSADGLREGVSPPVATPPPRRA